MDLVRDLLHHKLEKKRSKFDIIQYLPENERRKNNPVDSCEKLLVLLAKLIDDLTDQGEPTKGLRSHMIYVATMSSQGIYDHRALISYDSEVREKADKKVVNEGVDRFEGVDTALSNFHLGYAGTKHARSLQAQAQSQSTSNKIGGRGGSVQGRPTHSQPRQGFTGWR